MKINKEAQQKCHTQQWKQSEDSFQSFPGEKERPQLHFSWNLLSGVEGVRILKPSTN